MFYGGGLVGAGGLRHDQHLLLCGCVCEGCVRFRVSCVLFIYFCVSGGEISRNVFPKYAPGTC